MLLWFFLPLIGEKKELTLEERINAIAGVSEMDPDSPALEALVLCISLLKVCFRIK